MLLGDDSVGWSSRSSGGGSLALVILLVLESVGVRLLRRIGRNVGVKTGFLPGTVCILVKSSTAFLGSSGDDGGDLARWLGLDQIISELDYLGDPVMIIVKSNAGSRKDFRMAGSSVNLMVTYWFRSLSV